MPKSTPFFLIIALIGAAVVVPAQQTGDGDRDYSINGIGSGAASGVDLPLPTPGLMTNRYDTSASFAPVIWLDSPWTSEEHWISPWIVPSTCRSAVAAISPVILTSEPMTEKVELLDGMDLPCGSCGGGADRF